MKRTKYERKHVPFFCESCGKVTFEGRVFGQDRERHVRAESGTRAMYCTDCRPPLKIPKFYISPFFLSEESNE